MLGDRGESEVPPTKVCLHHLIKNRKNCATRGIKTQIWTKSRWHGEARRPSLCYSRPRRSREFRRSPREAFEEVSSFRTRCCVSFCSEPLLCMLTRRGPTTLARGSDKCGLESGPNFGLLQLATLDRHSRETSGADPQRSPDGCRSPAQPTITHRTHATQRAPARPAPKINMWAGLRRPPAIAAPPVQKTSTAHDGPGLSTRLRHAGSSQARPGNIDHNPGLGVRSWGTSRWRLLEGLRRRWELYEEGFGRL